MHTILFVPSTGLQSSATFPIALPGGSRTSRISGSEIIVYRYTGPIGLKHFVGQNRLMLPSTFAPPTECPLFLIIPGTVNAVVLEARLRDSLD